MELESILQKYFHDESNTIHFYGQEKDTIIRIMDFFRYLQAFECPDLYAKIDNTVLILEHFEFDSTKNNKKGSEYKKDLDRIHRLHNNINPTVSGATFHDKLNCTHLTQNYISNAIKHFENHRDKIEFYKSNLKNEAIIDGESNVEVGFFIEDTTCLGNVYLADIEKWDPPTPLILAHCKQFLDVFEKQTDVNYVFCGSSYGSNNFLWFISKDSVFDYREHQVDIEQIEILDFKPRVSGFSIQIPKK